MDLGVHLPVLQWSESEPETPSLIAYVETARRLGFTAVSVNDHVQHRRPWLDGPTALAQFERDEPDVVLLDLGMPDMDGYEVAGRLRETSLPGRVAIVALTGWGQDEDRQRVRDAGFDHHLVKPVDLASLQTLLTSLARSRAGQTRSA